MRHCTGAIPQGRIVSNRVWCLLRFLFGCASCVATWVKVLCDLSPPLVVLVLGPLGWDLGTGQGQALCVIFFGLPVCSYLTVYCLCLLLLDLSVHGRDTFLLCVKVSASRAGVRSTKVLRLPEFCFYLSAILCGLPAELSKEWMSPG